VSTGYFEVLVVVVVVVVMVFDPLLLQFRERVQDILPALPAHHDHYLLRWLRGERRGFESQAAHTHTHNLIDGQLCFCCVCLIWGFLFLFGQCQYRLDLKWRYFDGLQNVVVGL